MAAITDLSSASSVSASDNLVINQGGTDRKVTADKFAIIGLANTFSPASGTPITANAPSGTLVSAISVKYNTADRLQLWAISNQAGIVMSSVDGGSSIGPYLVIGRNSNASTPSCGHIAFVNANGDSRYIWVDGASKVRTHTAAPTFANDTAGSVVGDQTSSLDSKDIQGAPDSIGDVLAAVKAGADAVRRFVYKDGAYNGEEFSGVVVDYAPRYGMDRDSEHPAGKALNTITVIGDLLMAVANLTERVAALEATK